MRRGKGRAREERDAMRVLLAVAVVLSRLETSYCSSVTVDLKIGLWTAVMFLGEKWMEEMMIKVVIVVLYSVCI